MASLELFNTLSGKVERLEPVGAPALRMYACGPTVYDYGHIGNFRTFLHVDVLRRFLRQQGMAVDHVMNVTDVGHLTSQGDEGEDKHQRATRQAEYEQSFQHESFLALLL